MTAEAICLIDFQKFFGKILVLVPNRSVPTILCDIEKKI
jgi:hypothetical protein